MIKPGANVQAIRRELIQPFFRQPRESFDYDRLAELADSLRERGQLNPIVVRVLHNAKSDGPKYEICDGERRWRAAGIAKLDTLLAIVSDVGPGDAQFVLSVVANSAREDLTPLEQSRAVARIAAMPEYNTRDQAGLRKLAAVFGRSSSWARQMLNLNGVAPEVKSLVETGKLSVSSASKLADIKSPARQAEIGKRIASSPMRSRAAENAVRNAIKVERVREGKMPLAVPGTKDRNTTGADVRLMRDKMAVITEATEGMLDLPVARLRHAYEANPKALAEAVTLLGNAAAIIAQLRSALDKLKQGGKG